MTVLKLSHRYDGHTLRRTLLTRLMFMESQYAAPSFYRRRTWDLERWWLSFMYIPGSGDVGASSGVVSVCICSLVILCGNSFCSLGLPESHWVLPLMDARLFSVGHISALLLKVISLLLQWLPLLGLLWKSYLGDLTSGWVAGNNGAYAASLEFVLLISFWSSSLQGRSKFEAEKQWDLSHDLKPKPKPC